jgi:putative addiction module component (TIGR02574 family)
MTIAELKVAIAGLPVSERAELAQYLLHTLEPADPDVGAEWLALAERRMADVRAGKVVGIPAAQVMADLSGLGELPEPVLTEAQRRELERRVALVDAGKTVMSSWEDVEARILAGLRG